MEDLNYLQGRVTLACIRSGFHGIQEGEKLALRTFIEDNTIKGGGLSTTAKVMIIELTTAAGARHQFHAYPEQTNYAQKKSFQRIPNPFSPEPERPPIQHHTIDAFVKFFHVPSVQGAPQPSNSGHALMDLIEAIIEAANRQENSFPSAP